MRSAWKVSFPINQCLGRMVQTQPLAIHSIATNRALLGHSLKKKKTSRVCYECLCLEERQNNNNNNSNNSTRLSNSSTQVPRTQRTTKVPQECRKAYGLGNRRLLLSPRTCLRLGQTLGVCPVRRVLHICHLRVSLASSRDKSLCYQMAEAGSPLWAPDMGVERQSPRIGEGWGGKVCLHVSFP